MSDDTSPRERRIKQIEQQKRILVEIDKYLTGWWTDKDDLIVATQELMETNPYLVLYNVLCEELGIRTKNEVKALYEDDEA